MDQIVQFCEPWLEFCLIGLPRYPVSTGSGFALERIERYPERVDGNVVEGRGELLAALSHSLDRDGATLGPGSQSSLRK